MLNMLFRPRESPRVSILPIFADLYTSTDIMLKCLSLRSLSPGFAFVSHSDQVNVFLFVIAVVLMIFPFIV